MAKDFTVTVDGERGEEFQQIFGTKTVHVKSPFAQMVRNENTDQEEAAYMLDLELLTDEQRQNLIQHFAGKYGATYEAVKSSIEYLGVPTRASETVVTVENPQKWLLDDEPWDKAAATEEVEPMSDLDDPFDEFDGFDEY